MSDFFKEYRGLQEKNAIAAAAIVEKDRVKALSQIVGGTAVAKKVRGGSMVFSEIILHGSTARFGDYIVADRQNSFFVVPKADFEKHYAYKGPLRVPVV